jgi:DNA (cytosine-5)-methyltransferase 1
MNTLKVGTDCSGIDAPIQALKKLNISFKHVFSSEINKYCVKNINENYKPSIIFNDITKRKIDEIPDIDLYVCGFPCQPFSKSGKKLGFDDYRGNIFFECMNVIKNKKPKYFILENVKGILSNDNGKTWNTIEKKLNSLNEEYNIYINIYNTADYGIPQNRERLYIIGILKILNKQYKIPPKIECNKLNDYIDFSDNIMNNINFKSIYRKQIFNEFKKCNLHIFLDLAFLKYFYTKNHSKCSCITASSMFYNLKMNRYANTNELLKLQGFPESFKNVCSKHQFTRQIGNSMSVNVLYYILKEMLL